MVWLFILLFGLGHSAADFSDILDGRQTYLEDTLLSLMVKLQRERFYDTLLIYGGNCVFQSLQQSLAGLVATVLVSSGSPSYDWNFSSLTLILVCNATCEFENKWDENYVTRIKLQGNRRLILLPEDTPPESVCDAYMEKDQYNIAMVRGNFDQTKVILACRCFEDDYIDEVSLLGNRPIYTEQFRNMQGEPIITMADEMRPRSMTYWDAGSGEMKMTGYVANLVNTYAQRVNATLKVKLLGKYAIKDIPRLVMQGRLDIGVNLHSSLYGPHMDITSYPVMLTSYCVMLQVPEKLPYNLVYAIIVDPLVLCILFVLLCLISILLIYSKKKSWQDLSLANVLLNDKSLRGLLGQSFPFPSNPSRHLKAVLLILFISSIMMTTMYDAYLQSYFTEPPMKQRARSFKEFGRFHQKLAMTKTETMLLQKNNNSYFLELSDEDLELFEDWHEYLYFRDTLNTSYGYTVTEDRWTAYAEQQKMFKEPIFYFASDLCFHKLVFLFLPLRRHLPFRHLFEEHLMSQHEFGLVHYWKGQSFFQMVSLGLMPMKDLSQPKYYNPSLLIEDISWILKLYFGAMMLSILCFLLEIGSHRWSKSRK
ncbi:hypothetical protein KR009_008438 [Drosophila setifemur]|nr:hypothetical protein KR009_008438 [Drosophila setifemur]